MSTTLMRPAWSPACSKGVLRALHGHTRVFCFALWAPGGKGLAHDSPAHGLAICAQAIRQQTQLGAVEGLGKLHSNLAACFLQQEHFSRALQACQAALQVHPSALPPGA